MCLAATAVGQSRQGRIDPVGVWNCLMYGPFADQRFYLRFTAQGATEIARITDVAQRRWVTLGEWRETRGRLRIRDEANEREFFADLERPTLGGVWSAPARIGGWWCAPVSYEQYEFAADRRPPGAGALMAVLVPAVMATPSYPRQAIRDAKEGRAVSCFLVDGRGEVSMPDVIELTDEVFRAPTLDAVTKSSYRGLADENVLLPACRTFTFELQAIG